MWTVHLSITLPDLMIAWFDCCDLSILGFLIQVMIYSEYKVAWTVSCIQRSVLSFSDTFASTFYCVEHLSDVALGFSICLRSTVATRPVIWSWSDQSSFRRSSILHDSFWPRSAVTRIQKSKRSSRNLSSSKRFLRCM